MIHSATFIFAVVALYFSALLAVALWVERQAKKGRNLADNPTVYSLSLAVYCTSWTFYGSVGVAARSGLLFLAIYLGSTLAIGVWWLFLRRMVHIKALRRITSIADFISVRYDRSQGVAALVAIMALIGTVPYIALQIKAVSSSFLLIVDHNQSGASSSEGQWDISLVMTLILALFTILVGVRRLDPTERHQGMVVALALESLVKLLAFLASGIFVTFFMFDGVEDLFSQLNASRYADVARIGDGSSQSYILWMTFLVLSASAIQFLPRQFHVAVVENNRDSNIRTAMWGLPLYLLLINLFVLPLAAAGLMSGVSIDQADTYVLLLPLQQGQSALAMLVFIGGVSAATGMIMISAMTLSTMAANHLLLPLIQRSPSLYGLKGWVLQCRWLVVLLVMLAAYGFTVTVGESYMLVAMGIISFVAAIQFVPAIIGGIFWRDANRSGAILGLSAGFVVWVFSMLLPAFIKSGWLDASILSEGLFGWEWLRPEALFGMEGLHPVSHGLFWTLVANLGGYVFGSLYFPQSGSEQQIADEFVDILQQTHAVPVLTGGEAYIDLSQRTQEAHQLLADYLGMASARERVATIIHTLALADKPQMTVAEMSSFHDAVEIILSGAIGSAAAHAAMRTGINYDAREAADLKSTYTEILSQLRVSPRELLQRVNYHQERGRLQNQHAEQLSSQITLLENEICARQQAEADLERSYAGQQFINGLLLASFESTTLNDYLQLALNRVMTISWLPLGASGAIYLKAQDSDELLLAAESNLDPELKLLCATVPYGTCLCGRAASSGELTFASCLGAEHERSHPGMQPHGHYIVPMKSGQRVLGVMNLYLADAVESNKATEAFLWAVANTIGGVIVRYLAEQQAQEISVRLQSMVDNANAIIFLKDLDGRYMLVNQAYVELLGKPRDQVVGFTDVDVFGELEAEHFIRHDRAVIQAKQALQFEEQAPHKDGVKHVYLSTKFPLFDSDGEMKAIGGIATDITARIEMEQQLEAARDNLEITVTQRTRELRDEIVDRKRVQVDLELEQAEQRILIKRLEETHVQLLQAEKMASVGQLAAGVAHEINNPIGFVNSNLGALRKYTDNLLQMINAYQKVEHKLPVDDALVDQLLALKSDLDLDYLTTDIGDLIEESLEGVGRVKRIVQDLKDFSRASTEEHEKVDLHQGLESTLNVVRNEIKYKAEVVKEYGDIPPVDCIAPQINQVILNQLVNAAQAIEKSGTITIRTGRSGDQVYVEISDTGAGISEEILTKIFDPFFTTKPVGTGTGLGLSLSFGIIKRHGGLIEVESTPGEGSTFRTWLPIEWRGEEGSE